jgi:hypothetical protein
MGATVELMVLAGGPGNRPRYLLEDGGVWRDPDPEYRDPHLSRDQLSQGIERLLAEVMREVGRQVPVDPLSPTIIGQLKALYERVLPRQVREALHAAAAAAASGDPPLLRLHLATGEWVPWELLHDGTDFLGLRFLIARLPTLRQENPARGALQRQVAAIHNLLGNEVLDDGARADWAQTFAAVHQGPSLTAYPNGNGVFPTLDQVGVAAAQADVLHITCHGGRFDPDANEFYWTLDDGSPQAFNYRITSLTVRGMGFKTRPLVFGNACASLVGPAAAAPAAAAAVAGAEAPGAAAGGFGADFMAAGALNFIGTIAPISKTMAVAFARRFYDALFGGGAAGKAVAVALWETKRQIHGVVPRVDPSYLFYALYGPAEATYVVH